MASESWDILGGSVCQRDGEREGVWTAAIRRIGKGVCDNGCRQVGMECTEVEHAEYTVLRENWGKGFDRVADYES